ncbi:carbohydrate binding-domain-containing protein [Mycena epipterygia]|nr:carbohydrate binding-domain-containing protein [Mycena epipterygia]
MARLISIVLTAFVAGVVALESCGTANYDPSQYTCFNNSLLCPIVNGVSYQACGEDCYSTAQYT